MGGEGTFKSLLFVPSKQESESFNKYGQAQENIKLYVRRVFITDDFKDMMPNYLSFVKGVVDSDDLPLNVSRETLQQHKLLKVIKKKLVRKTLDMIKKISDDKYDAFWKEYSTNIKLGVIEDTANRVVVTSKHNDDKQHVWESDANSFSVVEDPRGDTLKRGTQISLYLKEESRDYLEQDTVKELIKKYSQFINFNIYLWGSKTETVEEPIEEEDEEIKDDGDEVKEDEAKDEDEEGAVEEEKEEEEKKPKTKKVDKTTWDWELCNQSKPIWTRKPEQIEEGEYEEFYKAITKDKNGPMTQTHFIAEGEVTFKSLLFVPSKQESESFNKYGQAQENIKLYVRRVFITDDFKDMMPNYLSFVKGVVDSDDLPLNVSRETLQQHKLLK